MYGAAKSSESAPTTRRARSPARLVCVATGRPRRVAQAVSSTASATPTTCGAFAHFGSRSFCVWTPGITTVAQSTKFVLRLSGPVQAALLT